MNCILAITAISPSYWSSVAWVHIHLLAMLAFNWPSLSVWKKVSKLTGNWTQDLLISSQTLLSYKIPNCLMTVYYITYQLQKVIHVYLYKVSSSVFLISSYGTTLSQRTSHLALHNSLFGRDDPVNFDYIVTNSINSVNWLKMYSQWCTY